MPEITLYEESFQYFLVFSLQGVPVANFNGIPC